MTSTEAPSSEEKAATLRALHMPPPGLRMMTAGEASSEMRAYVGKPDGPELRRVAEPRPGPDEVLVQVEAFSVNRGELGLFAARPEGWRPGQDIAGRVLTAAANGGGPAAGSRVAAMVDFGGWAERVAE